MTIFNFIKLKLIAPLIDIRSRINVLKIRKLEKQIKALNHRLYNTEMYYKNLTSIGVDVHFKSPHMIFICTRLKGGQIHHISFPGDYRELQNLVQELKERYRTNMVTWDRPYGYMKGLW